MNNRALINAQRAFSYGFSFYFSLQFACFSKWLYSLSPKLSLLVDLLNRGLFCSSPVRMYWKSYCTTPGAGIGVGVSGGGMDKMLKFYVKSFYVMGKALSGELVFFFPKCFR